MPGPYKAHQKDGNNTGYIKACTDASPDIVLEMAYAEGKKGQKLNANVKKTYGGGQ